MFNFTEICENVTYNRRPTYDGPSGMLAWFKGKSKVDNHFWMFGKKSKFEKERYREGILAGTDDVECPELTAEWAEYEEKTWTPASPTLSV